MDVKNKVLNYINKNKLVSFGDSIICAVSGGADSVCMLDILLSIKDELSLKLYVAHLNHGLRGKEADNDESFVKGLCEKYSLPFYSKNVNVNELSKRLKISCEEAGRIARYGFFDELRVQLGAVKVSTAHNKNDNVETVLMRIFRGTDLKGLSGIPSFNENNVIRPILCLNRKEIEEYLRFKDIDFVTDSTNLENDFTRNKIRNTLIPTIIDDYNSGFIDTFASDIELFSEGNDFIEKYVSKKYNELSVKENFGLRFDISSLLKEDAYIVKRIIKTAIFSLCNLNIANNLCSIIYDSLTNDTVITISKNLDIYVKYNSMYLVTKKETANFSYHFNSFGTYYIPEVNSYLDISEFNGKANFSDKNTIYLSTDKVECSFILRSRKNGDRIKLQNCGYKKLGDIFTDAKIPIFLRDEIPVLEYNKEIIWVCGMRDDPDFRKSTNDKYIKISLHKENNHA